MEPRLCLPARSARVRLRPRRGGQIGDAQAGHGLRRGNRSQPARAQRAPASVEARVRARRGAYRPRRPRRLPAWLRALGWLAIVLASLLVVTWRQTQGLELEA